mmetsp:Transcript_16690/g.30791  ORF Transcript_16690/g.30791 Transcript_16690/m.30791 type:complete len:440 (-) Transcript_16690:62-1381(-)
MRTAVNLFYFCFAVICHASTSPISCSLLSVSIPQLPLSCASESVTSEESEDEVAFFQSKVELKTLQAPQHKSDLVQRPLRQARLSQALPPAPEVLGNPHQGDHLQDEFSKKAKGAKSQISSPASNASQPEMSNLQVHLPSSGVHTRHGSEPLRDFVSGIQAPEKGWALVALIVYLLATPLLVFCYLTKPSNGEPPSKFGWPFRLALLVSMMVLWAGVAYFITIYYTGAVVEGLIANYDVDLLGVEVHMDSLRLNPFSGYVHIKNLEIENPPGYKSAYLLHAENIKAKIAINKVLFSFLKTVDLDLSVDGVKAIYDQYLTTSNVEQVLNHLKSNLKKDAQKPQLVQVKSAYALSHQHFPSDLDRSLAGHTDLALHKVSVTNSKVRTQLGLLGGIGITWSVPDLFYEDFELEFGKDSAAEIVDILLSTILESILRVVKQHS